MDARPTRCTLKLGAFVLLLGCGCNVGPVKISAGKSLEGECRRGRNEACYKYALQLLKQKQEKKAVEILRTTCDKGNMDACRDLGVCYQKGMGIEKNAEKSAELYTSGCDNQDWVSCRFLGFHFWNAKEYEKAIEPFAIACEKDRMKNAGESCRLLAEIYTFEIKEPSKAFKYSKAGCDLLDQKACIDYGKMSVMGWGEEQDKRINKSNPLE